MFSRVNGISFWQIYAVSSPVVVTSHVNQDTQAMATITWDYAAADIDRKRLDVPDKVINCNPTHILFTHPDYADF